MHNVSALDPNGNDVPMTGQSGTITLAVVGGTLSAGSVNAQAGQTAAVPIRLNAGTAQVVNFSATFTVVAQGGAPAITDKLIYQAATPPGPPQLTDDTVPGSLAIGYVNDVSPPLTGTLVIGTLQVPIPAGATGSYLVQVLNVSALDSCGNDVPFTGQPGTITIVALPTGTPTNTQIPTPTSTPTPTPPTVVLRLGDVAMAPGDHRVPIPVFLENSVGVRALQFDVKAVPAQVTLHPTPAFQCVSGSRAARVPCAANQVSDDTIRVVFLATANPDIGPGSDQIATLFVNDKTPSCSSGSVTQLELGQPVVREDGDQLTLTPVTVNGSLLCGCDGPVLCGCKGDLDENKDTDIFDVLRCVDLVLERVTPTPDPHEQALTDLDCDGGINVVDCSLIVDVILGRLPPCPGCS